MAGVIVTDKNRKIRNSGKSYDTMLFRLLSKPGAVGVADSRSRGARKRE